MWSKRQVDSGPGPASKHSSQKWRYARSSRIAYVRGLFLCLHTRSRSFFFLDVVNASCCDKSDIRILAVNSSISGMRVPRDKGRMPKMKRIQRTKGLSARAFEGPGSTQSQIDKMNEKADLHRHDRVQWHVNPKSCYSDPRRRSDTCRVMMRQWEAREGGKS